MGRGRNWFPFTTGPVLRNLASATLLVSITLPQAILLWTEPDTEQEQS
jgi:hypothetical protein